MRVHDISQPVSERLAVWPGDEPVRLEWPMRRAEGDPVDSAAITMSVHAGTHVDGPAHVLEGQLRAAALPPERFIGPALIVDARGRALDEDALAGIDLGGVRRVLFRTREHVEPSAFPEHFEHVGPALARLLVDAGVELVGTDAPSVDPQDSDELETHRILIGGGVAILENLLLDDVAPGTYTLVALPLKLVEADSAPVRAVLIEGGLG